MAMSRTLLLLSVSHLALLVRGININCQIKRNIIDLDASESENTWDFEYNYNYNYQDDATYTFNTTVTCVNVTLSPEKPLIHQLFTNFSDSAELEITIVNSTIPKITESLLQDLNRTRKYYLMNNSISIIEPKAFQVNRINIINLNNNNLKVLNDIFTYPCALLEISLDNNFINEFETFNNCMNLEKISMSNNIITTININHFSHLQKLRYLKLNSNYIVSIHESAFVHVYSLEYLDFNNNFIKTIPDYLFKISPAKTGSTNNSLYINFNNLTAIPPKLYRVKYLCINIYLENNNIKNISIKDFMSLSETINLNLQYNLIDSIAVYAFNQLIKLVNMDLSHNSLQKIELNTFTGLKSLKMLNISYNKFIVLDIPVYVPLESMVELNFEGNYLHSLHTSNFSHFKSLKYINLDFHKINCHMLFLYVTAIHGHGIEAIGQHFNTTNLNGIPCTHTHRHANESNTTTVGSISTTELLTLTSTTPMHLVEPSTSTETINRQEITISNKKDINTSSGYTGLVVTLVLVFFVIFGASIWFSKKYLQKRNNVDELRYNILNMRDSIVDN